jgi:hypothetical protein
MTSPGGGALYCPRWMVAQSNLECQCAAVHRRVDPNRLARERRKLHDPHRPPVPVKATLPDAQSSLGLLLGWCPDRTGRDQALRGLILVIREYAPGLTEDWLGWLTADRIDLL